MSNFFCKLIVLLGMGILFFLLPTSNVKASVNDTSSTTEGQTVNGYLYLVKTDGTIEITGCLNTITNVVIPDTIDGKKVTSIGDYAFGLNDIKIQSVSLPGSVTSIGKYAFNNCYNLKTVKFRAGGLKSIGDWAFASCKSLSTITIPGTITSIGQYAFSLCSNLTSIKIPKSVKKMGYNVFYGANNVKILCNQDSVAHKYAIKYIIPVKLLGPHFTTLNVTLYTGEKKTLKVAGAKNIKNWKSSNTKVLKVSKSGVITAVKKGTAKVTVTADNNTIACKVTVKDPSINIKKDTITAGQKLKLKILGTKKTPVWKSSNTKIATVTKKGVVTAKAKGTVTITAKVSGKKYTCKITVKSNVVTFPDITSLTAKGSVGICSTKISYNGKSMVVEGYIKNNTNKKVSKIHTLNLKVYSNFKLVAQQTYKNINMKISPFSKKKFKLVISSKNVKNKSVDLRINFIQTRYDGKYISSY